MPAGEFAKVTIPLYYEGHAYRAGSRIRVTIAAPNGTQPIWDFEEAEPVGTSQVAIAYGKEDPSRPAAPGRPRHQRPERPAAVPRPPRRALPHLRPLDQPPRNPLAVTPPG